LVFMCNRRPTEAYKNQQHVVIVRETRVCVCVCVCVSRQLM